MKPFRAVVLALVPVLFVLAACSGGDQPSSEPPKSGGSSAADSPSPVPIKPPRDRACYRLSYQDAIVPTNESTPVDCHTRHTSMTFAVGKPRRPHRERALATRSCPKQFARFIGGTLEDRRLSMLRTIWFTPTAEQAQAGASWYRCDGIAVRRQEQLARLTGAMSGVLDTDAGRDHYGMCGTAEPGTRTFDRVICAVRHSWRAIATVPFPAGRYPGVAKVRAAGEGPCEDAGRSVAADSLNFRWSYEWPTAKQWAAGQTYGLCWAPSGQ